MVLALSLAAASPALAQPGAAPKKAPAPTPAPAPAPAPASSPTQTNAGEDMAAFEKDLDALFVSGGLTSEQAAVRAAKTSPAVMRNAAEVDAAYAQAEAAELTKVPQIGGHIAYTRLSAVDPIVFPNPMDPSGVSKIEIPVNAVDAQATIAVPLSDYLLRVPKLIDAAHAAEDVARTSKKSSEVRVGQDARIAYYEWIRAKLQVLIAQRQHLQVQAVLKQVRALAEAQRMSKADLMRVEAEEAGADQTVNALARLAALREEQLRIQIGADLHEPLQIGEDVRQDIAAPDVGELDSSLTAATKSRLEFKVLDKGIEAKELQRSSEKASRYPRLSAFVGADYANPNNRIFPLVDKFNFTWQAGLQLSWTLNDTLLANTTLDRLEAETNELRADRESLLRGTRIEILAAQHAVTLAQLSLVTSQKGLAAAEEGYRVRRELLLAERATVVELVDSETVLTRARIAALNARVDLRVAIVQLAHALGQDIR
jgi:outer membrane protein TolC